ncbi:HNH endonuclease signature motif containing protein [Cellulomonas edaphi]|uniref:DUF222 domain-containing protein n=1 Tax=Cellulomonas edaphi TaxID=3053468 RepID=A0ABT7SAK6_9CELL|nr:HNH endonuclease signature motif containing protein [Cellulomons edaphi]MDM7832663.1 DUF222 domain-containing protein [Cellulomons edaphi]
MSLLSSLELADLSAAELVEVVAGWHQVSAMAAAHQGRAIAEVMARKTPMREFVSDELACAMTTTKHAVDVLAGRALGMQAHPVLADALLAGSIDARKVDVILEGSLPLGAGQARARLIAEATEAARGLTAPQLVRHVRRQVLLVDPTMAEKRAAAARADRGVELQWANDSMARLIAFIPAAAAISAYTVIDALAGATDDACDTRTVDQRRADAFTDIFGAIIDDERTPGGVRVPRRHGSRALINVTAAATTLMGLDDQPAELAGYGPIPASVARELAQDATWRRILTDAVTGAFVAVGRTTYRPGADLTRTVLARDVTCTYPGCRQPAMRTEIDHIVPYDAGRPGAGQTCADNLHALCKRHHQAKTAKVWNVRRDPATGNTVWTSPLGITYARSPIQVVAAPELYAQRRHRRPPPRDDGDPPF